MIITQAQSRGLSLARGFIVLIMPAVHSVWLYSDEPTQKGWLGMVLAFLAEGPGAQLFMFLMGALVGLGRPRPLADILKRGCILFLLGYLLNVVKLIIPYHAGFIPPKFFLDNGLQVDHTITLQLLSINDILQFAGISYMITALIRRSNHKIVIAVIAILVVLIFSPYTWPLSSDHPFIRFWLTIFKEAPPYTFFPVFPWLVYPLTGMVFITLLIKYNSRIYELGTLFVGMLLLYIGGVLVQHEPEIWQQTFYRLGTGGTIQHIGVVLIWVILFIWFAKRVRNNFFFRFLEWLSKNITLIYFVQWVTVFCMLPVFGYNSLGLTASLVALVITSAISFALPYYYRYIIQYKKLQHEAGKNL